MSKATAKKAVERRKKARKKDSPSSNRAKKAVSQPQEDVCQSCEKSLKGEERALFVEEEVGRIFCSEDCIADFFSPEVDRLEKEYFDRLSKNDLTPDEREQNAHLRWVTLQEPEEIWREKTLAGDFRYTLISHFDSGDKSIWCVCICLFLRGEPSFLYLAFPTRQEAMVNLYRKGERVQWAKQKSASLKESVEQADSPLMDGLADEWTEDETMRAQLRMHRKRDDIPEDQFDLYNACMDETLEHPDELWASTQSQSESQDENPDRFRVYHFIKHYPDDNPATWYVIVARETEDEEQIEILDAFPTRDFELVEHYRRGDLEIGSIQGSSTTSRLVH